MKKTAFVGIVVMVLAVIGSCRHEPVLPDQKVSFSTQVLPVIQGSCQHAGCHGTEHPEEFQLLTYNDVVHDELVVPFKPRQSKLYQSIVARTGENAMPRAPYPALSDRQVQLIYTWIAQGAENN